MDFDVERARRDTPGCNHVNHLNNAGASLMPAAVVDAVKEHLDREATCGGYEAAAVAEHLWQDTYDAIAELIGCTRDEVALVENATRAWDMAFYALEFGPGDRILTGRAEYGSNYLAFLQVARRTGARIEVVPNDEHGQLSAGALEEMLDEHVRLIAITHVPTNGGLINPAAEVGRIAREAGVLLLLDACQSAGQLDLDVEAIRCDMMAVTGRKFLRGPRGTGFLYVRRDLVERLEPPFIDVLAARWESPASYSLRGDARRFENWETNYATRIGLGVSVRYALGWGVPAIRRRNDVLATRLRDGLAQIPGASVLDLGRERCAIVSFSLEGVSATEVRDFLAARRINVSVSQVQDTLLDMRARGHDDWVRASVHYFNTEEEIDELLAALAELQAQTSLRSTIPV